MPQRSRGQVNIFNSLRYFIRHGVCDFASEMRPVTESSKIVVRLKHTPKKLPINLVSHEVVEEPEGTAPATSEITSCGPTSKDGGIWCHWIRS